MPDVTEAIHVMQESMGIAGTTALEAEHTISGSIRLDGRGMEKPSSWLWRIPMRYWEEGH